MYASETRIYRFFATKTVYQNAFAELYNIK